MEEKYTEGIEEDVTITTGGDEGIKRFIVFVVALSIMLVVLGLMSFAGYRYYRSYHKEQGVTPAIAVETDDEISFVIQEDPYGYPSDPASPVDAIEGLGEKPDPFKPVDVIDDTGYEPPSPAESIDGIPIKNGKNHPAGEWEGPIDK